ncbi:ATP-dependent DNA ligase [Streptomyces sp. 3N207]
MNPTVVVEFEGDAAVDAGRWRHEVRVRRLRPDLAPDEVPTFGK